MSLPSVYSWSSVVDTLSLISPTPDEVLGGLSANFAPGPSPPDCSHNRIWPLSVCGRY